MISSAEYPLSIRCKLGFRQGGCRLIVDGNLISFSNDGVTRIPSSGSQISLRLSSSDADIPKEFALYQNNPNPFNPLTVIGYQLSVPGFVSLEVFDMLGREIAILVNESKEAGTHTVSWDGSNVPSGVYYYRLRVGEEHVTRKMLLLH